VLVAVISGDSIRFSVSNVGNAIVCDGSSVSNVFHAGWLHCASVRVLERVHRGCEVAGIVGGVECSDGEGQCAYNVTVWLCVAVCGADADACVVFVCSWATLRLCVRVREDTWRSHSGWCRRRGRM
jgi:hypothetical protein